jgi:hypothetical protein
MVMDLAVRRWILAASLSIGGRGAGILSWFFFFFFFFVLPFLFEPFGGNVYGP